MPIVTYSENPMLTRDDVIEIAADAARDHELPVGKILSAARYEVRRLFRKRVEWQLSLLCGSRVLLLTIAGAKGRVLKKKIETLPCDASERLIPLWQYMPGATAITIGWRMGAGEHYRDCWNMWWSTLSPELKSAYQKDYPAPLNPELCWEDFYS